MPTAITQNTIPVTRQAQETFNETVTALNKVMGQVYDAIDNLTNGGMVSVSGAQLTDGLQEWNWYFLDIVRTCQWMADTLGQTADLLQRNEENNVDLASGLQVMAMPTAPGMNLAQSSTMITPGQTVEMGRVSVDPMAPGRP